jgi:hypothetical protein
MGELTKTGCLQAWLGTRIKVASPMLWPTCNGLGNRCQKMFIVRFRIFRNLLQARFERSRPAADASREVNCAVLA